MTITAYISCELFFYLNDAEKSAYLEPKNRQISFFKLWKSTFFVPEIRKWQQSNRFTGLTGEPARPGWIIDDLNDDGACGDASAATVEKGEQLLAWRFYTSDGADE